MPMEQATIGHLFNSPTEPILSITITIKAHKESTLHIKHQGKELSLLLSKKNKVKTSFNIVSRPVSYNDRPISETNGGSRRVKYSFKNAHDVSYR